MFRRFIGRGSIIHDRTVRKNCWLRQTPMESGLLLLLIVCLAWLAVLIAIYVYGSLNPKSEMCVKLCCHYDNASTLDIPINPFAFLNITFKAADEKKTAELMNVVSDVAVNQNAKKSKMRGRPDKLKRDISSLDVEDHNNLIGNQFPYIGALVKKLFWDSEKEIRLRCAVIKISTSWALASRQCVENFESDQSLSIRFDSDYWSKGGRRFKITKMIVNDAFTYIRYNDEKSSAFNPGMQLYQNNISSNENSTYTFTWHSNFFKYKTLETIQVNLVYPRSSCPTIKSSVYYERFLICAVIDNLQEDLMGPLMFFPGNYLMGIHFKSLFDDTTNRTFLYYLSVDAF